MLLDSGPDGDLVFVQEGTKLFIPFKERYAPQKWRTSNGIFTTTKIGVVDVVFPKFLSSKVASFKPDVVTIPKMADPPAYDLIIGVKSLAKIGAVLDFATYKLTIDSIMLPMHHTNSLNDLHDLHNIFREHFKPKSTHEATHRAIKILGAKYEKADLSSIVNQQGNHLTTIQHNKLLRLLIKY